MQPGMNEDETTLPAEMTDTADEVAEGEAAAETDDAANHTG